MFVKVTWYAPDSADCATPLAAITAPAAASTKAALGAGDAPFVDGVGKMWVIKTCAADKITFYKVTGTGTAVATKAEVKTGHDGDGTGKFELPVVKAEAEKDGMNKCKGWGDATTATAKISFKADGWAKPDAKKDGDAAASGAKTLAAAFTAGALAVAAT